jgi:hypothetical protein
MDSNCASASLCRFQVASAICQLADVVRQSPDNLSLAGDTVLALNYMALSLRKLLFQHRSIHAGTIAEDRN